MFFLLVILYISQIATSAPLLRRNIPFVDPKTGGGAWLNQAAKVGDSIVGEPLNVVISALSSPEVLTDKGLLNYANAVGFDKECLGLHMGTPQKGNLGDGNGYVNQGMELRAMFGIAGIGTCIESLVGGNHFRVFRQDGPTANTGALFLAVSSELDVRQHHDIVVDGYNVGRKDLVSKAVGETRWNGVTYNTTAEDLTGYLDPGSVGVNHGIATDGIVTLLTVTIVK